MAQKKNKPKPRQIGKTAVDQKKPLIDPRYKNTVWTVVIIIILVIFFIVNNTRSVPEHGPYPPGFNPQKAQNELHENQ
jgi:uncharacterized integral membrane protein